MKIKWLDGLVIAYGVLLIGMGIYATVTYHEIASLLGGGISGVLEIGLALYTKTNPRVGRIGSAVIALALIGMMGHEYQKSGKPNFLILTVASVIVFACLLGGHFYAMSKRKSAAGSA